MERYDISWRRRVEHKTITILEWPYINEKDCMKIIIHILSYTSFNAMTDCIRVKSHS